MTVYAAGRGLFKSTDGGASWATVDLANVNLSSVAIDPETPTTLSVGIAEIQNPPGGATATGVWRSLHGGTGSEPFNFDLPNIKVQVVAVDPLFPGRLHAGTPGKGVFSFTSRPTDIDFTGDGSADLAVYRGVEGRWIIRGAFGGTTNVFWGAPGDLPVPADYDGDGKADVAVYRPSTGQWFITLSATPSPS